MKETVLLYNLENSEKGQAIITILKQLGVTIRNIHKDDILQTIGYVLELEGFEATKEEIVDQKVEDEMLIIHGFSDEQINLMLDVFKEAKIPFIPLKAVVTTNNVNWSFYKLHGMVKEEYEVMANTKSAN